MPHSLKTCYSANAMSQPFSSFCHVLPQHGLFQSHAIPSHLSMPFCPPHASSCLFAFFFIFLFCQEGTSIIFLWLGGKVFMPFLFSLQQEREREAEEKMQRDDGTGRNACYDGQIESLRRKVIFLSSLSENMLCIHMSQHRMEVCLHPLLFFSSSRPCLPCSVLHAMLHAMREHTTTILKHRHGISCLLREVK